MPAANCLPVGSIATLKISLPWTPIPADPVMVPVAVGNVISVGPALLLVERICSTRPVAVLRSAYGPILIADDHSTAIRQKCQAVARAGLHVNPLASWWVTRQ